MRRSVLRVLCVGSAGFAISGFAIAAQTIFPTGSAAADTCVEVGNRASVSTCADLTDVVGEILTPGRPDRGPGDWTPNIYNCLGWDGQWVNSNSCT
ncbi:MAG: hypothetical protein WCP30_11530 [Mycobacteriaceae bacterium]